MSQNPVNLLVRFLLELSALAAMGAWGWRTQEGWLRWALAIGAPLVAATLWGVFRVPGDGGTPVVIVPGWVRLALEAVFFASATAALFYARWPAIGWAFGAIVVVHYAVSYDRIVRFVG